jgi:hypothetical protein
MIGVAAPPAGCFLTGIIEPFPTVRNPSVQGFAGSFTPTRERPAGRVSR